jgi:hypothetical protein
MAVDPSDPDTLYFAGDPLVISHDGGVTFKSVDAPLAAGKTADRLWTDRAHPGVLYSTSYAGRTVRGPFRVTFKDIREETSCAVRDRS